MVHTIYKITNLINNKVYIGRTNNIKKRWNDHSLPSTHKRLKHIKLYRAFHKYGIKNFIFEKIKTTESFEEAKKFEGEEIYRYKSHIHEFGYNMVVETDQGVEFINPELAIKKGKKCHESRCKTPRSNTGFHGVSSDNGKFRTSLDFQKKLYKFHFNNLEDAAMAWDMLCIYFYGKDHIKNFPEKQYTEEDLILNYNKFENYRTRKRRRRTKFYGVCRVNKGDQFFQAKINYNKISHYLGMYNNEIEAAIVVDKCRFYFYGETDTRYNFPDKIDEYKQLEKQQIFEEYIKETTKFLFNGVSWSAYHKKYVAAVPYMGKKMKYLDYYSSRHEAAQICDMAVLYLGLDIPLNRPDLIEEYNLKINIIIPPLIAKFTALKGITKKRNGWAVRIKHNYFGFFKKKEDAEIRAREVWAAQAA